MSITIGQSELETIASRVAGLAAVVPSGGVHNSTVTICYGGASGESGGDRLTAGRRRPEGPGGVSPHSRCGRRYSRAASFLGVRRSGLVEELTDRREGRWLRLTDVAVRPRRIHRL
jgi:hypothetical protein